MCGMAQLIHRKVHSVHVFLRITPVPVRVKGRVSVGARIVVPRSVMECFFKTPTRV